jgi:hypothetical protein
MKKYTVSILALSFFAFLLLGCGSDSKANANDGVIGGSTSLSIVYESTSESAGKLIGHYHVHAVGANGKPLSGLSLNMSLINGVKQIRGQKLQNATGRITDTNPISFHDDGVNFAASGVVAGDSLIVLPSSDKADVSYLGDWKIVGAGTNLELRESSYLLENTEGLTYIIGNEQRLLGGSNGGRAIVSIAHIQDANSTTNAEGFTNFDVVFDTVLAAHTVTIGVHTNGNRWAAASVITLRGGELTATPVSVKNTGETYNVSMRLLINGVEDLIGLDTVHSSFSVAPEDSCAIDYANSNLHTDAGGHVSLSVVTKGPSVDVNGTESEDDIDSCTVTWAGGSGSVYYEY